ncbi:MAG: hypothetical protein JSV68_25030 [Anaerolineaceae bacterium]|nr:MAG: hypothetical protein JSV68_25030 [Anaerolineaceae bacterium]
MYVQDVQVLVLATLGGGERDPIQHPVFGQVYVVDELVLDTLFKISWKDDNPQTTLKDSAEAWPTRTNKIQTDA